MQDYFDFAEKNGVTLIDTGNCQFCNAKTSRGVHECLDIFNFGFSSIDFALLENHIYKFLVVDAHTLQHPEIHGRWSNHFHLSRLTLILEEEVQWTYQLSPKLSDTLKAYKVDHPDEILEAPAIGSRGAITTTDIKATEQEEIACKNKIRSWAREVYSAWETHHGVSRLISRQFFQNK